MKDAGHILMKQAYLLVIPGGRKIYGESVSLHESVGRRRLSPDSPKVREPAGAAHDGHIRGLRIRKLGAVRRTIYRLEKRPSPGIGYECYGMDLVGVEPPGDAVARMNPDFIRKKRQRLESFVVTLGPHGSEPRLGCGRRACGPPNT